jgi:asparagine synthase (glutamine-hydrolysing)
MSGVVGIIHLDRVPVDPQMLQRLTDCQRFRGPDAQRCWIDGHVGFGHTLLKTSNEPGDKSQPLSLDGHVWIVADARVDGQHDLVARLTAAGQQVPGGATDAELILRAYHAWGEGCVNHLLGDFAFGIWDRPRQRLFCARDHMGVKPFYYAKVGSLIIFSNTLDALRQHPAITDRLNDLAIADFLLFDMNQDPATTSFADIQRLPAAHLLQCDREAVSVRRYWTLSVMEPVHFKQDTEYLECFQELLDEAVKARLHANGAGILMSGGLDSPTVAATAKRLLTKSGNAAGLFAQTLVLDELIPDDERHYAGLAAAALGIPIGFRTTNDCQLFDRADKVEHRSPAPEHSAWPDRTTDLLRQIATKSRIALTGNGGDPGLSSRITAHFHHLLHRKQFVRAVYDAVRYLCAERRFSRLYLRARWRLLFRSENLFCSYPDWLNEDLERQFGLRDRWTVYRVPDRRAARRRESSVDAFRPEASVVMSHLSWQGSFEGLDPGVTRVPVEVRHPFFDLRVVTFLLGLPRLPWCGDKELLRQLARGVLPEAVRLRPKSPLRADPTVALLQKPESAWVDRFEPVPEIERYIRRSRIPAVHMEKRPGAAWVNLRPLSLNYWLRGRHEQRVSSAKYGDSRTSI